MSVSRFYQIRIEGRIPPGWEDWFGGMEQQGTNGDTLLTGYLPDQSALLGVLDAIHNLGLNLISVSSHKSSSQAGAPPKEYSDESNHDR